VRDAGDVAHDVDATAISSTVTCAPASSMSPPTIVAPASESMRAEALPIPLATPVSTATRPDKSNKSCTRVTGHLSIAPADNRAGAYATGP
jgi:hypothetical protein